MFKRARIRGRLAGGRRGRAAGAACVLLACALFCAGCFPTPAPEETRDERVLTALESARDVPPPPSPLSPEQAVAYALLHNLDSRIAELEIAYQDENLVSSRLRMLPSLTARASLDRTNHPAARWSRSLDSGRESLESSYSSEQTASRVEIGALWNILDFGVGYLKSRQQAERVLSARFQAERAKQQVALDVLSRYWHAAFTAGVAREAEALRRELEDHAASIRDSVDMRILSAAEGARRELVVHNGLSELSQWTRAATQAKLELARVMGAGLANGFDLEPFPNEPFRLPASALQNPESLQIAALRRRPELYRSDTEERIALDDARTALLQIAPNASLSLNLHRDPDQFLEWNNWMVVGARASWNLFSIPTRLSERRAAQLQGELARQKGLALAAGVMAQVGIAWSDFRLAHEYAGALYRRAGARARLVTALAAGEEDGQSRAGEVLQERVRLLSERAAAMRAGAEAMIAGARLANAVGVRTDGDGAFVWEFDAPSVDAAPPAPVSPVAPAGSADSGVGEILAAEKEAAVMFPAVVSGVRVVRAEEFLVPDAYIEEAAAAAEEYAAAGEAPAPPAVDPAESRRVAEKAMEGIARNLEAGRREREAEAREQREQRRERLLRGER